MKRLVSLLLCCIVLAACTLDEPIETSRDLRCALEGAVMAGAVCVLAVSPGLASGDQQRRLLVVRARG